MKKHSQTDFQKLDDLKYNYIWWDQMLLKRETFELVFNALN